jgi:site-specific DNA recombinase
MRLLGAARLSRDTDESTSIERQDEQIGAYAQAHGHEVVHVTKDSDVSGIVKPSERGDLGPWLTDPAKLAEWDALAVVKIDRLSRSLFDFVDFMRWAKAHGKILISIGEGIDFSTPVGKLIGNILAMFAEFERERMSERRADAARKARREGRWDGRAIPAGYKVEGSRYVRDPEYGPIVAQMAMDRMAGHSLAWIARKLTEQGVKPRGGADKWRADKVLKILRNPSLNGIITSDGKILRDDDGKPLRFTDDPILDDDCWAQLQAVMGDTGPKGERLGGFMLTRVAWCPCGQPLYGNRRPGGRQSYYRCSTGATDHKKWCGARVIPSDRLEQRVEDAILTAWGDRDLYRRTVKPAKSHQDELRGVERQIADVEAEYKAGNWPAASAARMLASLEAERERLAALPEQPAREEWEPAGITVAGHWASLDSAARGLLLRTWGVRVVTARDTEHDHITVALQHGQPDGFEHASGLLMPHWPEDHEPLFEVAGVLVKANADGSVTVV